MWSITLSRNNCAEIFKQSLGARNRVGIELSSARQAKQTGGIDNLESILVLLKSLQLRALYSHLHNHREHIGIE
jgi:hypothetical protein